MNKILVLFVILLTFPSLASRYAYTTNYKTVVYADKSLDIPIGFIKSGRKIQVGDKSIKNDTVVALIVTGRIAYLKVEDITFKLNKQDVLGAPVVKEHDVDLLFLSDQDKLSKNNYILTSLEIISGGSQWKTINNKLGQETTAIKSFSLGIEHRTPESRKGFGIKLNYIIASSTVAEFNTLTMSGEYQYMIFHNSILSTELFAGFHLSGDVKLKTKDQNLKGVAYGTIFGGRVRFMPYSKINFFAHATLTSIKPSSLGKADINGEDIELEDMGGSSIGAGVSFAL